MKTLLYFALAVLFGSLSAVLFMLAGYYLSSGYSCALAVCGTLATFGFHIFLKEAGGHDA